jgi:hypothetical protein
MVPDSICTTSSPHGDGFQPNFFIIPLHTQKQFLVDYWFNGIDFVRITIISTLVLLGLRALLEPPT